MPNDLQPSEKNLPEKPPVEKPLTAAFSLDAYTPEQMAHRVETVGIAKASLPTLPLLALSILAGAFIAFGAMLFTVVMTHHGLGFGIARLIGGLAFSLGLILVVVGGAELFTGNVLLAMGWADRKISTAALLRNWSIAYFGNFVGAVGMAILAHRAGLTLLDGGAVGATAIKLAQAKVALPFWPAFFKGILCNALVCLAVWLCFAARGVADKILAIVFPITAFVTLGFEHSIANMYFVPMGMLAATDGGATAGLGGVVRNWMPGAAVGIALDIAGMIRNLVPVTLGNIVGGGVFVALSYYVIYLRPRK